MGSFKIKTKEEPTPRQQAANEYQTLKTQKANPTTVPEIAKRLELIERILRIDTTGQAN